MKNSVTIDRVELLKMVDQLEECKSKRCKCKEIADVAIQALRCAQDTIEEMNEVAHVK